MENPKKAKAAAAAARATTQVGKYMLSQCLHQTSISLGFVRNLISCQFPEQMSLNSRLFVGGMFNVAHLTVLFLLSELLIQ